MSDKLGFYELIEPYITFGLAAKNLKGTDLLNVRNAVLGASSSSLRSSLSGAQDLLEKIVTGILDFLSVEELHTAFNENAVAYRGFAKFGGEGRASPDLPTKDSITSSSGQELSWFENRFDFRLTVPRRSGPVAFDTTGLTGAELTDLQQLNSLLNAFTDNAAAPVSDLPGTDFRLELLIKTVRLVLPKKDFIPARVGADGWLEPDPSFNEVVLEFPTLAFVLEQHGEPGNLDFTLRSWDSAGFDDPGDADTARFFTITPPFFLHSSRCVGFGIERLVADFSDNVTPPEILQQFGIGDDFNGFWLPLIRIFVAPGRTTGFAFAARGKDLLFDLDKGVSGEIALDILRRGGEFNVEPVFYSANSKTPVEFQRGNITRNPNGTTDAGIGAVIIPGNGEMHIFIRGSISPYQVEVKIDEQPFDLEPAVPFDPDVTAGVNRPKWLLPETKSGLITIKVTDKDAHNTWNEMILVLHAPPPGPKPPPRPKYQLLFNPGTASPDFRIVLDEKQSQGENLVVRLVPDLPPPKLMNGTQEIPRKLDGTYKMVLTPGTQPAQLVATWDQPPEAAPTPPGQTEDQKQIELVTTVGENDLKLFFDFGYPIQNPKREPANIVKNLFAEDGKDFFGKMGLTPAFVDSREQIVARVQQFLDSTEGNIAVSGFASKEVDSNYDKDDSLSGLRAQTLKLIINKLTSARTAGDQKYGHRADEADGEENSDARFRVAIATSAKKTVDHTNTATAELIEIPVTPVPAPQVEHPPEAKEPERPPIFRRISFRVRFERSKLVLGEISGQFDFRLQSEEAAGFIQVNDTRNNGQSNIGDKVTTPPGASQSGEQGVLDYRLTVSYDTATRRLTEELALGFDQQSRDGWVNIDEFNPVRLANTLGSLMVFAPLLNAGIDSAVNAEGDEAVKNAIIAGAEVAIATTLGITGMLKFRKLTLFGIELSATQLLPDNEEEESTRFGNIAALFDYAVDFEVDINLGILTIRSKRDSNNKPIPIRVRYRGFGFRLNFDAPGTYEAVFDTSKGFDLGLAEPGALVVGGPLGPILRVDSVKVARQNPLILETDLGLNVNLGVIEVESVRVRVPIEPPGPPTIIPTGISVNIPGTIVGSGFLDIRDNGFTGAIDVTLVPLKLRMQASVGLQNLEVGERHITAFFLGIGVEFPAPIPLANSGLGIYGLLGLFGMHYKRDEEPPVNPNLPVALDWFYNKAKGEPHLIAVDGRPTWVAAPDRWSFGVGLVLGTMEGAFVLNLKGMLVLELPGPRILIFVKAQILQPRPPSGKPADQSAGILAVIDINFQVGYIAVGLIFTYEIKDLLRIEIPIDTQFSFHDIEDWHVYIGSLRNKASADILGIAKGTAYLMFDGKGIPDFPLAPLNGFSIAAGIAASLVLGDEDSGLYAKVSGALDAGVTKDPLHFIGRMTLEGRIHLWFIGLGASAKLDIEAPEPLFVKGEVCGSVDLWLTEVEGCVGITIGDPQPLPDPEAFITGVSLQSHSPALTEGQATDHPVDSSLGVSHNATEIIEEMPIDVIPVVQMKFPPVFAASATGLKPSSFAPTLPPNSDGWFSLGGVQGEEGDREVRYEVQSLTISPALPNGAIQIPVTWWQPARPNAPADSQATDKGVNLALNSWIPVPFPRSYQRSQQQIETIRDRFEVICKPIAPATSVLWTFNAHFTVEVNGLVRRPGDPFPGYSSSGWKLNGAPWPDPPGSQRTSAPRTVLHVHEPDYPNRTNLLLQEYATKFTGETLDFAKVIPPTGSIETGQALQFPFLQFAQGNIAPNLPQEIVAMVKAFLEGAGSRERIVVESGDVVDVHCLISANMKNNVTEFMRLRSFNEKGDVVEDIKLPGRFISSFGQLPASWCDTAGPWFSDVQRVFQLSNGKERSHGMFLVEWKPAAPMVRFELVFERPPEQAKTLFRDPPAAILGVVETLTREEVGRETAEEHYQDEMIQVVVNSLEEGDKRPLFAPNTVYTVTAQYRGQIRKANDHAVAKSKNFTQQFKFKTTAHAPKRLNPWVLACVPENDEGSHFVEDKVQFIFNDSSAIQMYTAFGKTLKAVLRKANGNHPPDPPPTINEEVMEPITAVLHSPYSWTMHDVILEMPCIPQVIETEQHQVFTVDIPLERGTSYVLDIESTPPPEDPVTPIFRTSFTTSRFLSASELADVIEEAFIRERPLKSALTLPTKTQSMVIPDDTAANHTTTKTVQIVTDAEMEAALRDATGSDVPPAGQPGLTMLWSSDVPAKPVAVLLDSPESILRTRPVAIEVTTPTPDDDAIQHFQTGRQMWLELVEKGTNASDRIVYTTGGCRAVVFLKPGATAPLRLALRQYRHTLLTADPLADEFVLAEMPVPKQAPWEI